MRKKKVWDETKDTTKLQTRRKYFTKQTERSKSWLSPWLLRNEDLCFSGRFPLLGRLYTGKCPTAGRRDDEVRPDFPFLATHEIAYHILMAEEGRADNSNRMKESSRPEWKVAGQSFLLPLFSFLNRFLAFLTFLVPSPQKYDFILRTSETLRGFYGLGFLGKAVRDIRKLWPWWRILLVNSKR